MTTSKKNKTKKIASIEPEIAKPMDINDPEWPAEIAKPLTQKDYQAIIEETPGWQAWIKSSEEYQKRLQDEIDESNRMRAKKESRILQDIARQLLKNQPEEFKIYAWEKLRAEYGSRLAGPCGKWGAFDMASSITGLAEAYNFDTIFQGLELIYEQVIPKSLPAKPLPATETPQPKPTKVLPFPATPLLKGISVEELAAKYDSETIDEKMTEHRAYLKNLRKGKHNDHTT